jgi:hypothetical protein
MNLKRFVITVRYISNICTVLTACPLVFVAHTQCIRRLSRYRRQVE